jgi:hypothetical protein
MLKPHKWRKVFARARGFGFAVLALVGLGLCRVAAAQAFARSVLAVLFITISHCAWRHFISFSDTTAKKKQKQRKRLSTIG